MQVYIWEGAMTIDFYYKSNILIHGNKLIFFDKNKNWILI